MKVESLENDLELGHRHTAQYENNEGKTGNDLEDFTMYIGNDPEVMTNNTDDHLDDLGWNEVEFIRGTELVLNEYIKQYSCPYEGCDYKHKDRNRMGDHYRQGYE